MLKLTRTPGESIYILPDDNHDPAMTVAELFSDGPIRIQYTALHSASQVTIGISAPPILKILRDELISGSLV